MKTWLVKWIVEDDGQDLIEYGMLAGLIALVCFAAVEALGESVANAFSRIGEQLADEDV